MTGNINPPRANNAQPFSAAGKNLDMQGLQNQITSLLSQIEMLLADMKGKKEELESKQGLLKAKQKQLEAATQTATDHKNAYLAYKNENDSKIQEGDYASKLAALKQNMDNSASVVAKLTQETTGLDKGITKLQKDIDQLLQALTHISQTKIPEAQQKLRALLAQKDDNKVSTQEKEQLEKLDEKVQLKKDNLIFLFKNNKVQTQSRAPVKDPDQMGVIPQGQSFSVGQSLRGETKPAHQSSALLHVDNEKDAS